jgi:hypothetical protein
MLASTVPSTAAYVRGLWETPGGRRWLAPLIVFLCITGVMLILAATVEAVAPFIYTLF